MDAKLAAFLTVGVAMLLIASIMKKMTSSALTTNAKKNDPKEKRKRLREIVEIGLGSTERKVKLITVTLLSLSENCYDGIAGDLSKAVESENLTAVKSDTLRNALKEHHHGNLWDILDAILSVSLALFLATPAWFALIKDLEGEFTEIYSVVDLIGMAVLSVAFAYFIVLFAKCSKRFHVWLLEDSLMKTALIVGSDLN